MLNILNKNCLFAEHGVWALSGAGAAQEISITSRDRQY